MILRSVTSIRNVVEAKNRHISRVILLHNKCRPISQNGRLYWKYPVFLEPVPLFQNPDGYIVPSQLTRVLYHVIYRVFHFEVNISAPRLDLRSKYQQILTLARTRSIWDFQLLGAKARAMPVNFSDALDVKHVH
jgi:hypothetical protein